MYSEGTFLTFFSLAFLLKIGDQRRDGRRHGTEVRNLAQNRSRFMNLKGAAGSIRAHKSSCSTRSLLNL
jgi:hypothetical protein